MDWSLSIKSLKSLTNEEECPMYTFKILVRYLAKLYVEVPQAETMGVLGNLPYVFLVNHKILLVDWNYLWGAVDCIVTEPIGDLSHVFP